MAAARKTASGGDMYVARQSFSVDGPDGAAVSVHGGITRVRAGHWLLEGREAMFELLTAHYDVEAATAAPGETRG
jgi:hypothetical protein